MLNSITSSSLKAEPQPLYDLVVGSRGIPHPSWPNQPQQDTKRSIIDEVDADQAKIVIDFCYEVMRISGGNVDVSNVVSRLYDKCKGYIVEKSLYLNSLGINIKPLADILIKADDYTSASDLSVIALLLTRQTDGNYMVDDAHVKDKIQDLVDNATIVDVEKLIDELVKDKQLLEYVAEYVASLDSEAINNLPISISKHAVSTFKRDNADSYKDNVDFLTLVLEKGNSSQKKEVVRLMKAKINTETDLSMVVDVLDHLTTEDQNMLSTLVGELEGIKDSETVDEETKNRVSALATKLSASIKKPGVLEKILGKK